MKDVKRFRIISSIVFVALAICFVVLLATDLKFKYIAMYEWISIFISICALVISIWVTYSNEMSKKLDKYKTFVIETLERKRNVILKELANVVQTMCKELDINIVPLIDELFNVQIFHELFKKYHLEFDSIITDYSNAIFKEKDSEKRKNSVENCIRRLIHSRASFESEINEIIKKLFTGELGVKDIK